MRLTTWRCGILILLFMIAIGPPSSHAVTSSSSVALAIFSEDSNSPSLVEPSFVVGTSFNMTVQASNLPASTAQSGGLSGFDITLSYNSSIIKVNTAGFSGPFCPQSDGCIFDLPANDTLTVARSFDSPAGQSRLAMLGLGPSHRSVPPSIMGQPSILFRVEFDVIGKGVTPVNIVRSAVQLLGLSNGCGSLLPFTAANGSFDNRDPFTMSANPTSGSVSPGQSQTVTVNVSRVNSAGDGDVNLTLSGITPQMKMASPSFSYNPKFGTLNGAMRMYSFTSTLMINTTPNTPLGKYNLTIIGVIPPSARNPFQYNLIFILTVGQSPMVATYSTPHSTPQAGHVAVQSPVVTGPPSLLASFTVSSSHIQSAPVTFNAVAVWCAGPPYSVSWNFGDGSSGTTNPITHIYNNTGTYPVTLTVVDSNGTTSSSTQNLNVLAPPRVPPVSVPPSILPEITAGVVVLTLLVIGGLFYSSRRRRSS